LYLLQKQLKEKIMDYFGLGAIIVIGAGIAWVLLSKNKENEGRHG
jgi:hypothetical protein